jgi:RimJ/RimL family protein N-acetyltransferase
VKVQRTKNIPLIKEVMDDEKLIKATSEDGTDIAGFTPEVESTAWIALIDDKDQIRGFVIVSPTGRVSASIHVAIRTEYWGDSKTNVKLGKLAVKYAFDHGVRKLTAEIPTPDQEVLRYAQRVGFKREGVNKQSFLRNGELLDQTYVGLHG